MTQKLQWAGHAICTVNNELTTYLILKGIQVSLTESIELSKIQWIKYEQEKRKKEKESKRERIGRFIHRYMLWNIENISGPPDFILRVLEDNLKGKKINHKICSVYKVKTNLMVLMEG